MSPAYVLPVDKPSGPTSHDVVGRARRALATRRIGHTGTLDPFASGLLLLCVGGATRLAEYLSAQDKTYEATLELGRSTDTDDRTGRIRSEDDAWRALTDADVVGALAGFHGSQLQTPPPYSAKKVAGQRAYDRARRGESVALEAVRIDIHALEALGFAPPRLEFRVTCSSGTYVRALARDIGAALGTSAHLTDLRRTAVGRFRVEAALVPEALEDAERVRSAALSPLQAVGHLPSVALQADEVRRVRHGQALPPPAGVGAGVCALAHGDELVAVAEVGPDGLRPRKVFVW